MNKDIGKESYTQTKMLFFLSMWKNDNMSNYNVSQYLNMKFQMWNINLGIT